MLTCFEKESIFGKYNLTNEIISASLDVSFIHSVKSQSFLQATNLLVLFYFKFLKEISLENYFYFLKLPVWVDA